MGLLTEATRSAWARPIASLVTALIVGASCATILLTTGQSVQAEQQVLAQIDAVGTRSITLVDEDGTAGIMPAAIARISRISGVDWVVGLGPATDVVPLANEERTPAPMRVVFGRLPPQLGSEGAAPNSGEAIIGSLAQKSLGLIHPLGVVVSATEETVVVGGFRADDPLSFLDESLLVVPQPSDIEVRSVHILVSQPDQVAAVADAAVALLGAENSTVVAVETSEELARVRAAVRGELGRYGRQLIALVLGAGLVLTGLNVYGSVTLRRRDFGRRRALGATRTVVVALVALQTGVTAIAGALVASSTTVLGQWLTTGTRSDYRFAASIGTLAVLAATAASLPPAFIAAHRDPVRVLRVP